MPLFAAISLSDSASPSATMARIFKPAVERLHRRGVGGSVEGARAPALAFFGGVHALGSAGEGILSFRK